VSIFIPKIRSASKIITFVSCKNFDFFSVKLYNVSLGCDSKKRYAPRHNTTNVDSEHGVNLNIICGNLTLWLGLMTAVIAKTGRRSRIVI